MADVSEIKGKKEKVSISRIIMIILLALILIVTATILVLVVSENGVSDFMQTFQAEGENTILLEQFVVNLKDSRNIKHYIKITMALMYTDSDQGSVIESNINKIRDVIIATIRTKSYADMLEDEGTITLKSEMMTNINKVLDQNTVKDIYFTDIIVQ